MTLPRLAYVGHMSLESLIILMIVIMGVKPVFLSALALTLLTPISPLQALTCKTATPWLFLANSLAGPKEVA